MIFLNPQRYLPLMSLLLLAATAVFLACGSDSGTNPGQQTAQIQGRVTDDSGFSNALAKSNAPVEGATVTVVQLQADGSLKTVSNATVETNVNGEFLVETDLDGVSGLIVIAQKNNAEWKAVVSSEVQNGNTTKCQPHNDESSTEAEVDDDLAKRKRNSRKSRYIDIAAFVNTDVAANVKGDASAISQLGDAIESEAEAHAQTLTDASVGVTQSQIDAANSARVQAQANLETALYDASGNQSAIDAALTSYANATASAYSDASIAIESHAKAKAVSSKVLIKNATGLSTNARLALQKRVEGLRAQITSRACETQFTALGAASARVNAVVNAGTTLRASIKNAGSGSEIMTAFDTYHDSVISELQASSSSNASAIVTMDAAINGVGGAKLVLNAAVSAALTTDAVVNAYINFYNAVKALVSATLTTATETEIKVIAEVLILANLSV